MPGTDKKSNSPWIVRFDGYDPREEGRREAVLALGNGVFATRAAAIDVRADAVHYPGTYRAGCYDRVNNDIAGERVETESLVNLPNWLPLNFRICDGPWFHLDDVEIADYVHQLDLRSGVSCRAFVCTDALGRRTRVRELRLVSMADPRLGALRLELAPLNWSGEVSFCSALDGHVANTDVPRYADYEHRHLEPLGGHALSDRAALLRVRVGHSGIEIAQAACTTTGGDTVRPTGMAQDAGRIAQSFRVDASAGRTLTIEKIVLMHASRSAINPAGADQPPSAPTRSGGFASIRARHARAWEKLWSRAAIEADDDDLVRTLRLHAFHILQTVSPHSAALDVGIPARGWHGEAYRGHIFWDELFIFPFLHFRFPALARALLLYRYRRLDAAREAGRRKGYRGAMYPWRSAGDGREVTPHYQKNPYSGGWMRDHTHLQRHIGSAIVFNVWQYYLATGDAAFLGDYGAEMILEIARFWASIARPVADRFEIRGVMGPDEFHDGYPHSESPGIDNNAYTNAMAAWTLCRGLEVLEHLAAPRREELRRRLDLGDHELALWERISRRMYIPFDGNGIISQFDGFERLPEFHPEILPPSLADKRIDWALRAVGKSADDYQVTKQADTATLFYLLPENEVTALLERLGYACDRDGICRTMQYHLARTAHQSSLSHVVYAGALARLAPSLSWQLYRQALRIDLDMPQAESTAEGIHLGAMGATLDILQRRYLGISADIDGLRVDPAPPAELGRLRLALRYRGADLDAEIADGVLHLRSRASNREAIAVIHDRGKSMLEPGAGMSIACSCEID